MLHFKDRKGSTQNIYKVTSKSFFVLLIVILFASCKNRVANPNLDLTLDKFSDWRNVGYALNSHVIRENIYKLCHNDDSQVNLDYRTRSYYLNEGSFVWIERHGVDYRADSLIAFLDSVTKEGISPNTFYIKTIKRDLQRVRNLDFEGENNDINSVMARLEYYLTKSYVRYVTIHRFGFMNPQYVFNRLDTLKTDSTGGVLAYRRLFDVKIYKPGKAFFNKALRKVMNDSLCVMLHYSKVSDPLYARYIKELNKYPKGTDARMKIACNMERLRWYYERKPQGRYVLVNIPAFMLYTVSDGIMHEMSVGCGAYKTKTPLLSSYIQKMDLNPKWNVPMSIIKKDISVRHIGDTSFFDRNKMYILEKKSGKKISPRLVSASMLLSGEYRVIQESGEGNSLGRIIFRFPNSFSVFLHDTSTKEFFDRSYRGVSHGCVRVEKPLDLAVFLLNTKDQEFIDKLRVSMDIPPVTDEGKKLVEAGVKNPLGSLNVNPQVPLFITYFTAYPDANDNICFYPDVYRYDDVIMDAIRPYIE